MQLYEYVEFVNIKSLIAPTPPTFFKLQTSDIINWHFLNHMIDYFDFKFLKKKKCFPKVKSRYE